MIEASFDRSSRAAAVSGVYQYDTGQRLRMNGLPSPEEFLAGDDLLTGSVVTVQVQFGYVGDEQTEMGLAQWSSDMCCWTVNIPDEYLTRTDPVHVYVYAYYGENGDGSRAGTEYEGVFTPIGRPAPGNVASEDMIQRWGKLEEEVDLVLSTTRNALKNAEIYTQSANTAVQAAKVATDDAQAATGRANAATQRLERIEHMWDGMTVLAVSLLPGSSAYAKKDGRTLIYGIPKGADGPKGATGDTGPADIDLSFSDGVLTITPR